MLAAVDWTNVLDALIAGLPAIIASSAAFVVGRRNGQRLATPSGDTIGHVVERAHDLAAVATLANIDTMRTVGATEQPVVAAEPMAASVERLNADDHSPVKVNGIEHP